MKQASNLTIVNYSDWPDWFVNPVCQWIIDRAKIHWNYKIILPKISRDIRAGRGWKYHQRSRLLRRCKPSVDEHYYRYAWFPRKQLNTRLERFVHLVSHEARHANQPRGQRQSKEFDAEQFAFTAVDAFRTEWPGMKKKIMAKMRAAKRRRMAANPKRKAG